MTVNPNYACPVTDCEELFENVDGLIGHVGAMAPHDDDHATVSDSDDHKRWWYEQHCQYEQEDFDPDEFLKWLDKQEGTIPKPTMEQEWPNYPYDNLVGITMRLEDGEGQYYQRDLRQGVYGYPLD